jgi:hypothetical protein
MCRLARLCEAQQHLTAPGLTPAQLQQLQQQALTSPAYITASIQQQWQDMDEKQRQSRHRSQLRKEAKASADLLHILTTLAESQMAAFEMDSTINLLWSMAKLMPGQDSDVPFPILGAPSQQQRPAQEASGSGLHPQPPPGTTLEGAKQQESTAPKVSGAAPASASDEPSWPQPPPQLLQAIATNLSRHLTKGKSSAPEVSSNSSSMGHPGHSISQGIATDVSNAGSPHLGAPVKPDRPQHALSPQHLCMAVWGAAKLGLSQEDTPLWAQLTSLVSSMAPSLSMRDTCTCMWSLTSAGLYDPVTFYALSDRAEELLDLHLQRSAGAQPHLQLQQPTVESHPQHLGSTWGPSPQEDDSTRVRAQVSQNM